MVSAKAAGHPASIAHADTDAIITGVTYSGFDICPSRATVNDFFTVSGAGLPADTVIIFDGPSTLITVTPDVVRHRLGIGGATAALESPLSGKPCSCAQHRSAGGVTPCRSTCHPARPSWYAVSTPERPRTRATPSRSLPALQSVGALVRCVADPITSSRSAFHTQVAFTIDNLLNCSEDVLRGRRD